MYSDLWHAVRLRVGEAIDEHRLDGDRLWKRAMALRLPRHTLLPGESLDDVKYDNERLRDLAGVLAIWGRDAAGTARQLYLAHRRAKDRSAAKSVVHTLAAKAALLSENVSSNLNGQWASYTKRRRAVSKLRGMIRTFREAARTRGLEDVKAGNELLAHAMDRDFFTLSDRDYEVSPDNSELLEVVRREMSVDLDYGRMLLENNIYPWGKRYADTLYEKFHKAFKQPGAEQLQCEFAASAGSLLAAANEAAPADAADQC
jgi:hypothetical protein